MFDPEVPCRIMPTRRCEDLFQGVLLERAEECPLGQCFRYEVKLEEA